MTLSEKWGVVSVTPCVHTVCDTVTVQVTANVTAEVRVYRKYYRDVVAIVRKVSHHQQHL